MRQNEQSMIKRKLKPSDLFLMGINLVPIWGVWFANWNAREVFMVYCLESVIIGFYTLVKLGIASLVIRKDVWNETGGTTTKMPGLFFMIFFLVHYGFFIAIQLSIFLETSGAEKAYGISNAWDFLVHYQRYLSDYSKWLLLGFVISYGFFLLKDYLLSGAFRITPMGAIMFEPYGRIFVQQFTVIAGSLFLGLGAGHVFITIFAAIKIFFDVWVNYPGIIASMVKKQELAKGGQQ
jgi:hypothetical protein